MSWAARRHIDTRRPSLAGIPRLVRAERPRILDAEALRNWSQAGVEFSGIWLDMNDVSSFCDGPWSAETIRSNFTSADIDVGTCVQRQWEG